MKTYLKQASPDEREELAAEVKSSVAYFYLIGGGHRKPGTDLCKALVAKEPKLTLHELRPDIWEMPPDADQTHRATDPTPEAPDRPSRRPIDPAKIMSAEVVKPK